MSKLFKTVKIYTEGSYINALVHFNGHYLVVSDDGYDCLIYKANKKGKIADWMEITRIDNTMISEIIKDEPTFSKKIKKYLTKESKQVTLYMNQKRRTKCRTKLTSQSMSVTNC